MQREAESHAGHVDPDDLTLLALGEDRPEAAAHVAACPTCSDELDDLSAVVRDVREAGEVEPVELPHGLWERIAEEAGVDPEAGRGPRDETAARVGDEESVIVAGSVTSHRGHGPSAPRRRGLGVPRWSTPALVAAAVAGAVAVGVTTTLWPSGEGGGTPLAATELTALTSEVEGADVVAEVLQRDGRQVLVLDTELVPKVDQGSLEVWLATPDVSGLVPLGVLDAERQEFVLPTGLDLATYPVVDVSREPLDGDPGHGGDSIWRGVLAIN